MSDHEGEERAKDSYYPPLPFLKWNYSMFLDNNFLKFFNHFIN